MKNPKAPFCAVLAVFALAAPGLASPKTVTLNVPGMTCPACPLTVKKALQKVAGVSKIDVRYEKKQVAVTFDDEKTSPQALVKATADAGYPAQVEKVAK